MPVVTITTRSGRSAKEKKALLDAVHQSLRDAFKIPENDRTQRLLELDPADMDPPRTEPTDTYWLRSIFLPGAAWTPNASCTRTWPTGWKGWAWSEPTS